MTVFANSQTNLLKTKDKNSHIKKDSQAILLIKLDDGWRVKISPQTLNKHATLKVLNNSGALREWKKSPLH